jgi:hypothetical protein
VAASRAGRVKQVARVARGQVLAVVVLVALVVLVVPPAVPARAHQGPAGRARSDRGLRSGAGALTRRTAKLPEPEAPTGRARLVPVLPVAVVAPEAVPAGQEAGAPGRAGGVLVAAGAAVKN